MTLAELLEATSLAGATVQLFSDQEDWLKRPVSAVTYDSRKVSTGAVFVALSGQHTDGLRFAAQAAARGAIAVVAETRPSGEVRLPCVLVEDARGALAALAAEFYGHPSRQMRVVGITGTNGKTTTAYLLRAIFEASGIPSGLIGTVSYQGGDETQEAVMTTPESSDIQLLLRQMVSRGCGACAMEVSSHALALHRVDHLQFAGAIFTNLTRDHLDFHVSMEAYFAAKRRLFELLPNDGVAAINIDDPRGDLLRSLASRVITYAIDRPADLTPASMSSSLSGLAFDVRTPRGVLRIRSALVGRPNLYNILAATAAGIALDLPTEAIEQGVNRLTRVPGRFQIVSTSSDDITVVVDYAHTDDALRHLLETARPLTQGRLITVFGCGGERDRSKRPLMGAVAARLSDLVIVTSDNPRGEDPAQIIEEVLRGIVPPVERLGKTGSRARGSRAEHSTFVDRREAIAHAVKMALAGDVILLAGKGHEKYQVIGDRRLPFDDATIAQEALARRRSRLPVADK